MKKPFKLKHTDGKKASPAKFFKGISKKLKEKFSGRDNKFDYKDVAREIGFAASNAIAPLGVVASRLYNKKRKK